MFNDWSKKLKYIHVTLNEKLAVWGEKHAYAQVEKAKKEILRFKDMGCFGNSKDGYWECSSFYGGCTCHRKTCPMQTLNENYAVAWGAWVRAKSALFKTQSIANAVREDMGLRKAR